METKHDVLVYTMVMNRSKTCLHEEQHWSSIEISLFYISSIESIEKIALFDDKLKFGDLDGQD